jgi:hypothetical protein
MGEGHSGSQYQSAVGGTARSGNPDEFRRVMVRRPRSCLAGNKLAREPCLRQHRSQATIPPPPRSTGLTRQGPKLAVSCALAIEPAGAGIQGRPTTPHHAVAVTLCSHRKASHFGGICCVLRNSRSIEELAIGCCTPRLHPIREIVAKLLFAHNRLEICGRSQRT